MKKIILLIILLLLFSFGAKTLAQDTALPSPGFTPDSPFYFFDTLAKRINLFFIFSSEKKAEKAIEYAEERLAEVKAMAEKNKVEATETANQGYQDFLGLANQKTQEAKEEGKEIGNLAILITEKTLKHQEILVEVFERVPEEAKTAIKKAIEVSQRGSEQAVQAVTGTNKEELVQRIEVTKTIAEERIRALEEKLERAEERIKQLEEQLKEKEIPEVGAEEVEVKPSITILSPNGGERWEIGETYSIQWSTVGYNSNATVQIRLTDARYPYYDAREEITVVVETPNTGSYSWVIPSIVVPTSGGAGPTHKMQIYIKPANEGWGGDDAIDESDNYFSVVGEEKPIAEKFVTVISPNGGEKWEAENIYDITWTSAGVNNVYIYLHFPDGGTCYLGSTLAKDGEYSFKLENNQKCPNIPQYIASGEYTILIYSEDQAIKDSSDNYFSIVSTIPAEKSITVTSPNGGEKWVVGETYYISWDSKGVERVAIELRQAGEVASVQIAYLEDNPGIYSWKVSHPHDVTTMLNLEKLRVFIFDRDTTGISDTSDADFSIISAEKSITVISPNVFVVRDVELLESTSDSWTYSTAVLKKFYQYEDDVYDFVSIYTQFDTEQTHLSHSSVQNSVENMGRSFGYDYSEQFGSGGRLLGINYMRTINRFFDGLDMQDRTHRALLHETSHQWAAYVGKDLGILNEEGIHWFHYLNTDWDPIGGKKFIDSNNDGKYEISGVPEMSESPWTGKYSPLTQYLMGLIPPEDVSPVEIFEEHRQDQSLFDYYTVKKVIPIEKIIELEGKRIPTSEESQKNFRMAFILVIKKGSEATEESKYMIKKIAEGFSEVWSYVTDNRSTMNISIIQE